MQRPFFCCSALTPRSQRSIDELNVSAEGFLKNRRDRSLSQKIEGLKVKIRELAQHHFTLEQFIHATDRSTPLPEEEAIIKKYTTRHSIQAYDSTLSKQVARTILNALYSSKNAFELQKSQYEAVLRAENNPVHFPARPFETSSPSTSFAPPPTGRYSDKLELPSVSLSPAAQHLIEEPIAPPQSCFIPLPSLAHPSDTKSHPPTRQSITLMPVHHHSMRKASSVPRQTTPPQASTSSLLNNSLPTRHAFTPPPSTTTQSPPPPRNFHTPPPVFSHISSQKRYSLLERQTQEHIHTHSSLNACQSSPSFLPSIARNSTQVASHPVQPTPSQQPSPQSRTTEEHPSLDTTLLSTIEKIKLVYIHYKNKISQCESQETKETLATMFSDKIFSFILSKNFSKIQFEQLLQFLTTLPPLPPKEARDTKEDD